MKSGMVKPIRTKKDYEAALARTYDLMQKDLKVNSDEYNELELLSILLEKFEESNFPVSLPDL
jgi:HTH-type transcriptional regulator / antitoxin HigA